MKGDAIIDSFISWIGGKKALRQELANRFPVSFDKYIEVFGGAAWLLFFNSQYADTEIYNDYDSSLVNLFRCVKYHPDELQREVDFILPSREDFNEYKKLEKADAGWTDIQRAARFYQLIKFSYGAGRKSFGTRGLSPDSVTATLRQAHRRLSKVIIENKDFEELIKQNDSAETFCYCDPPYFEAEHYYNVVFAKEDHIRLKETLSGIPGKFLLSYNDCPFICELYKNFNIEKIVRTHNLKMGTDDKIYPEVIISNYDTGERERTLPKQFNFLNNTDAEDYYEEE